MEHYIKKILRESLTDVSPPPPTTDVEPLRTGGDDTPSFYVFRRHVEIPVGYLDLLNDNDDKSFSLLFSMLNGLKDTSPPIYGTSAISYYRGDRPSDYHKKRTHYDVHFKGWIKFPFELDEEYGINVGYDHVMGTLKEYNSELHISNDELESAFSDGTFKDSQSWRCGKVKLDDWIEYGQKLFTGEIDPKG
jgi:hypothetical protein